MANYKHLQTKITSYCAFSRITAYVYTESELKYVLLYTFLKASCTNILEVLLKCRIQYYCTCSTME